MISGGEDVEASPLTSKGPRGSSRPLIFSRAIFSSRHNGDGRRLVERRFWVSACRLLPQVVNEALSIGAAPTVLFRYSLAVSRQRRRSCPSTADELVGRVQGSGCRPVRPIEGDRLLSSSRGKRPGAMHDSHSHSPAQKGPPTVDGLNMQSVGARFYDSGPARF